MDDATAYVRVPLIDEKEATGRLAELYEEVKHVTDLPFVPDMFRLVSTRPDLLEVILSGYKGIFLEGVLPRQTRELICAWTSKVNQCPYCVGTHSFFLQVFGGSEELASALGAAETPEDLPLDERTKVLLRLLGKLCREPYKITDADWQQALDAGWSTDELLEAFFTTALFNFITRMVDGLGLGTSVTASRISQQDVPTRSES
ncbi:carboxymuconolactone decarboxylase family protein [Streptomyces sp. NPDC001796]|uniref:carboxymuconolactone decarboxylase family protein n=1 Tax=Streptomyces sp. NPDC001796 TaxID=3364609 RepID=UPI003694901F